MMKLLRNITLGFLSALLAISPAHSYTPDAGSQPAIGSSFAQAVANLPKVADYSFGSSATSPTGCAAGGACAAITNATQLATYFSPLQANTGTVKINSELESYTTSFTGSANHVFNSNNLALTGTLDGGGNANVIVYGNLGNNSSFSTASFTASVMGISDTSHISVGQIMVLTYFGEYVVTGITGSGGSATITTAAYFGSPTSIAGGLFTPWEFLPAYFALTNAPTSTGSTTLNFAAVPSGVAAGQFISIYTGSNLSLTASQNYTVVSKTSTTVTFTPALAAGDVINNGWGIVFSAPIRSGQIWSNTQYSMPGQNGATYFAMELTCQLPQNALPYAIAGTVGSAVSNGAYGAWPAFWLISGSGSGIQDASEIDAVEGYDDITRNMSSIDINVHTGMSWLATDVPWANNASTWSFVGGLYTYNNGTDFSTAPVKIQAVVTPDWVFNYINGVMVKKTRFAWTSQRTAQVGVNLAIGSLGVGLGTNNLFPLANTNFSSMILNVSEMKIWGK